MNLRADRLKPVLTLLLLAACATSQPKQKTPVAPMTELPPAALEVMCTRLRAEGFGSELRVVKETQAIVTQASLQGLAEASFHSGPVKPELIQAIMVTPLIPINPPAKTCISRFVSSAEAGRTTDVMVLQFASPFVNPFSRGQMGTLVRMSLGGESSTWYWVPLLYQGNQWIAGAPTVISVLE